MEPKNKEAPSLGKFGISFSKRQGTAISTGITVFFSALVLAFIGCILWALIHFISAISDVLIPFFVAMILATLLKPLYSWFYRHLWRKNWLALTVFFIFLATAIGLFIALPATWGARLLPGIDFSSIASLSDGAHKITADYIQPAVNRFSQWLGIESPDVSAMVTEKLGELSWKQIGAGAGAGVRGAIDVGGVLLAWLVLPIYLGYFLVSPVPDGNAAIRFLPFLKPSTREDIAYLIDEFLSILTAFFRGQIFDSIIQGVLFGLGFMVAGLPFGFLMGFILGLFNIVPYLGNVLGFAIILPVAFFGPDGGFGLIASPGLARLIAVLVVFAIVQTLDNYLILPSIQGKRTGLSNIAIIFSLFFWGVLFNGVLGMLLAIPLSAFIVVFWRLLKKKYLAGLELF